MSETQILDSVLLVGYPRTFLELISGDINNWVAVFVLSLNSFLYNDISATAASVCSVRDGKLC